MSEHGVRSSYTRGGCRCDECVLAEREYQRLYHATKNRVYGRGLVDAAPVYAHIVALNAAGMATDRASRTAGLAPSTAAWIMKRGPEHRVRRATADAIMAVRPPRGPTSVGLSRRAQGLASMGWTAQHIADIAGTNVDTIKSLQRGETEPRPWVRDGVMRAWKQLQMTRRVGHNHDERASVTRTITWAKARGFVPPFSWDEGSIDDPAACPVVTGREQPGAALDEFTFLLSCGQPLESVLKQMNTNPEAIRRMAERHKHKRAQAAIANIASAERHRKETAA